MENNDKLNELVISEASSIDSNEIAISEVENKVLTLAELVTKITTEDDSHLSDNVRRFKLMMVRRSMTDVATLLEAQDLIQQTLLTKIKDDITIYPITTLVDLMNNINKTVDRNISIMESILPKADDLSAFLAANSRHVTLIQSVNVDKNSPASIERISQVVEMVVNLLNSTKDSDTKGGSNGNKDN